MRMGQPIADKKTIWTTTLSMMPTTDATGHVIRYPARCSHQQSGIAAAKHIATGMLATTKITGSSANRPKLEGFQIAKYSWSNNALLNKAQRIETTGFI